ncbi:putative glucose dehydrogenase [Xylariales sp. PMI_506]|nr:putative glucose dehydrogenase [Xylariales sp. PMI_506]
MTLHASFPSDIQEVDVIVAGGGTSGCVVAARLADADPSLTILVVERGPNNDMPTITTPAFFVTHLAPTSTTTKFYKGNRAPELAGREPIVPVGSVLGGGSSINMMTYSRAQRSDFDSWGSPEWSANSILPYLKKLETYHGPGPKDTHGSDGPIHVSSGTFESTRVTNDVIAAVGKLGYPETVDVSNLDTNNAVQRTLRYINPDGKRQDTATCYIHPRLGDGKHPNLHVAINTEILGVIVDGKRAVGIQIQPKPNPEVEGEAAPSPRSIKARKMVIVSCGAIGTPLLLERSGIGSLEVLKRAGVEPIAEVPGVGFDYQDHQLVVCSYRSSLDPDETLDGMAAGRVDPTSWFSTNDPRLGWNCQDAVLRVRPTDADIKRLGPHFEAAWRRDYEAIPDRPLAHLALVVAYPKDQSTVPVGQYFSFSTFTVHPYSRGHVHITGPGATDEIDFRPGFFTDAEGLDIKKLAWAYKKQRELARRMATYRGEVANTHPPFATGSRAACVETDGPLADVRDIEYTPEDDAVLEAWLRETVDTTWHSLGTCKMAPREKLGVVDAASLGVYGVEGLKIADLSIAPSNVAANTNNTALVIGEKAADIFIKELGLNPS